MTSPPPTPTRPTSAPAPARTRSRPGTCSRSRAARAGKDPRRDLRDGLPQPVPHPGRRERRRVHHRLLAGLARQRRGRGPAGTGRFEIVRKPANYGWPLATSATSATTGGTTTRPPPRRSRRRRTRTPRACRCDRPAAALVDCGGATIREHLALEPRGRSVRRARPARTAADHRSGDLVLLPGQQRRPTRSARRARRTPAHAGTDRAGLATCPQLFPELGTGGVGPHGAAKYDYDPSNPNPTKFPAYYDDVGLLRRVHPRLPARDPARLAERRPEDQQPAGLRRVRPRRPSRSCATTRWT